MEKHCKSRSRYLDLKFKLIGNSSKARKILKVEIKYNLNQLVKEMIKSDLNLYKKT